MINKRKKPVIKDKRKEREKKKEKENDLKKRRRERVPTRSNMAVSHR